MRNEPCYTTFFFRNIIYIIANMEEQINEFRLWNLPLWLYKFADHIVEDPTYEGAVLFVKSDWDKPLNSDVDIGCGDAFGGAGEDERVEDNDGPPKLNIVVAFALEETYYTKKDYQALLKVYIPKLRGHLETTKPDRVQAAMSGIGSFIKFMMPNFNEFSFWTSPNFNSDGMVILSYYKEESDETPTFVFFKDGFVAQKY